jgi:hypothetical protein
VRTDHQFAIQVAFDLRVRGFDLGCAVIHDLTPMR